MVVWFFVWSSDQMVCSFALFHHIIWQKYLPILMFEMFECSKCGKGTLVSLCIYLNTNTLNIRSMTSLPTTFVLLLHILLFSLTQGQFLYSSPSPLSDLNCSDCRWGCARWWCSSFCHSTLLQNIKVPY